MLKTSQHLARFGYGRFIFFTLGLLLCTASSWAQPCVVELDNGDRIQGSLITLSDGVLKVETDWAGALEIDFGQVSSLVTEDPVTIETETGETRVGRLSLDASGELTLRDDGEEVKLALGDLAVINPPPSKPIYSGSVSLGANVQTGNTDQQTLSAAFQLKRDTEKNVFSLSFRWNDAEQNNIQSARSTFLALKYDRFLSERLYAYGSLEGLEDEFRDLDLRTVASVGAGYEWFDDDRRKWALEGGLSYFSRDYFSISDEDELTVRLASYFSWKLADGVVLRDDLVIYPSFEDESSLTFRNEFGLTTRLIAGWSAEFASILDYDDDPPPGFEEEDWLWILGLNYSF